MKFVVKARVMSSMILPQPYQVGHAGLEFVLAPNDKGIWSDIQIRKKLEDFQKFLPKFDQTKTPIELNINFPEEMVEEVQSWLQYLESILALFFRISRIEWQSPTFEWMPENEEERSLLTVYTFSREQKYEMPPTPFNQNFINVALLHRQRLDYLTIPLAFFREGMNSYDDLRYIRAYWYFYFFLEGLFGNGKSGTKEIIKEFLQSEILKEAVDTMVTSLRNDTSQRHLRNIEGFLGEFDNSKKDLSAENIVSLLVQLRGALHHFSIKSTRRTGHPFNEEEFESPAYLTMCISTHCFTRLYDQSLKEHSP
jgi:hypothetical protein